MVPPRVALHERDRPHVALDAAIARAVGLVVRVRERIDHHRATLAGRRVARHAQGVVFHRQFRFAGVDIVAVETRDPFVKHPAHHERAVLEVLPDELPVGMIDGRGVRQARAVVLEKRLAGPPFAGEFFASGVAARAILHVLLRGELERGQLFLGREAVLAESRVALRARDTHVGPRRAVGIGLRVVAFVESGRVAERTLRVPVHPTVLPVTPLVRHPVLGAIDREPLVLRRIERAVEHLEPAIRKRHQILDQRRDADDRLRHVQRRALRAGLLDLQTGHRRRVGTVPERPRGLERAVVERLRDEPERPGVLRGEPQLACRACGTRCRPAPPPTA